MKTSGLSYREIREMTWDQLKWLAAETVRYQMSYELPVRYKVVEDGFGKVLDYVGLDSVRSGNEPAEGDELGDEPMADPDGVASRSTGQRGRGQRAEGGSRGQKVVGGVTVMSKEEFEREIAAAERRSSNEVPEGTTARLKKLNGLLHS